MTKRTACQPALPGPSCLWRSNETWSLSSCCCWLLPLPLNITIAIAMRESDSIHWISRGSLEGCKSIVSVTRHSGIMTSHIWIWLLRRIFARLHPSFAFCLLHFRIHHSSFQYHHVRKSKEEQREQEQRWKVQICRTWMSWLTYQ